MTVFRPQTATLPPPQQALWPHLAPLAEMGFVLYGGTAVHGLAAARTLFAPTFQPSESLKALTYFEGGDLGILEPTVQRRLVKAAKGVGALPEVAIVSGRLAL